MQSFNANIASERLAKEKKSVSYVNDFLLLVILEKVTLHGSICESNSVYFLKIVWYLNVLLLFLNRNLEW